MNSFYSIDSVNNLNDLLADAFAIKQNPYAFRGMGFGKTVCMIFFNPSLRTRLSTQKAAKLLGLEPVVFEINKEGWRIELEDGVVMNGDKQEHIKEAAPVIGAYCDMIAVRSFPSLKSKTEDYQDKVIHAFMQYSGKPVINMESALFHPLQALADMVTIHELKQKPNPKVVMTWAPHPKPLPHSVPNSFARWALTAGFDLTIAQPKGYELNPDFTKGANILHNQEEALLDADFVYAKSWSCFNDYGAHPETSLDWTVTEEKMKLTDQARFMHCLPVRRNVVVSEKVLEGPHSAVVGQAENRLYAAAAVMKHILQTQKANEKPVGFNKNALYEESVY